MEITQTINEQVHGFLDLVAQAFNTTPELQEELKSTQGWINARIGLRSDDGLLHQVLIIQDGAVRVEDVIPADVNLTIVFNKGDDVLEQLQASPDQAYRMIWRGRVRTEGNVAYMGLWDYLVNLLLAEDHQKAVNAQAEEHRQANLVVAKNADTAGRTTHKQRKDVRLKGKKVDPGVKHLEDPYLSQYSVDDFPRLAQFREERLKARPEVCAEYGKLMTDFFIKHGYEKRSDGQPWEPNMRCAESYRYFMENRQAVIRKNDLLAGSYTPNPILGMLSQPNILGPYFWGELHTCSTRELEPFMITDETIQTLHKHVFPYWADRNTPQWWKDEFDYPLSVRIHERYFMLSCSKIDSNGVNSPGYERVLNGGLAGLKAKIDKELASDAAADEEKKATLTAMKISLNAVAAYAHNLARQAAQQAQAETNPARKAELNHMHEILQHVPEHPARTLDEAIQALIIIHMAVGAETIDDGPSMGRLDQVLQPFFERDMEKLTSKKDREAYVRHALELIGCLFLRINTHWPLTPDMGTWINSGSPWNTTIVVGGVTPQGEDAVNDMTYIILKVTEMVTMNDPNMHVRYHSKKNSRTYLERVCEVNYINGATPAIHGDDAVIAALIDNLPLEDARDWTPTGCVEPSIPGKHWACTASGSVNLVAPLEMAMNNGVHPLMKWDLGPKTGEIGNGVFKTFDDFFDAFKQQCEFVCQQLVIGDNQLGELYTRHYPGPLMSTLYDGCIEKGRTVIRGGARYNSSGTSIIGMTNVADSLMAIKKLVYDEKRITLAEFKKAINNNFTGYEKLHALVKNNVPHFGSGDPEAVKMANRVTKMVSDYFRKQKDDRNGYYTTGWWSMNRHTVYGRVTGALPSGRLDGEPFTPGLTPSPDASSNLLDNLLDVAQLDPKTLDNNIAFNVRIVPSAKDTHEQTVKRMADYVEAFVKKGGMQVQFNVVNTDTLKDAMAHPEFYPDLMVRVSGYCGYFTRLQRDLQLEIIRRSEYGL